ncbi:hypothetical protein NQ314_010437 [Rhamnusium bicolor]|uniref:ZAD domain-containing protein n=1 Tax=Rhamnusium bicolor TaxID=1586634 RepID=A0AAV8XQL0_9CUCU|nr:hypothetical protein NQ314_010437 [Rhamnusium bicolor]
MNGRDRKKCRLCLKTVYNNDEMKEITRPMLEAALFLHLNLEDNGALMCIECSRNLQNAYDFKSTCVNIVKKILPSVNPDENMKLNENNFRHDKNIKLIDGSEDQKVCRFCMKVTESGYFTFLQEKKEHIFIVDMVQKYIPELSLLNFISVCLDVKEKTENMDKTVKSQLKLNNIKVVDLKHEVNDTNIAMEEKYKCGEDITVKEEDVLELDNSEVLIKNKTENCRLGGADCLDVEEKTQDMNEAVESRLELNDVKEFKLKHELNYNIAMEDIYNECEDDITVKDETSLKLDNSELPIEDSETER